MHWRSNRFEFYRRRIEWKCNRENELGIHEKRLRGLATQRQLVLDLADETDRNSFFELIDGRVEIEDLYDLQRAPRVDFNGTRSGHKIGQKEERITNK